MAGSPSRARSSARARRRPLIRGAVKAVTSWTPARPSARTWCTTTSTAIGMPSSSVRTWRPMAPDRAGTAGS